MEKKKLAVPQRLNWPIWTVRITTLILIGLSVYYRNMGSLDEIWLFSYGKNLAEGLLPYRDINVCTTPLALYLLAGAIKIFGSTLWVLRSLSFAAYGFLFLLGSYLLQKKDHGNLSGQLLYALLFLSFHPLYLFEYNSVNCILVMLLFILEEKNPKWSASFLQGLFIGCIVLTKQTTGLITLICFLILFAVNKRKWKEQPLLLVFYWLQGHSLHFLYPMS